MHDNCLKEQRGPIADRAGELTNIVEDLSGAIMRLETKIEPVLLPPHPEVAGSDNNKSVPCASALNELLSSKIYSLRYLCSRVNDLAERVEL